MVREEPMRRRVGPKILASLYCLLLATGVALAVLGLFGLLPVILIIAAAGGLWHLTYTHFFNRLPDYLDELRNGSGPSKRGH